MARGERGEPVVVDRGDRAREPGVDLGVHQERNARDRLHVDPGDVHVAKPGLGLRDPLVQRAHRRVADHEEALAAALLEPGGVAVALALEKGRDLWRDEVVVHVDHLHAFV